MPATLVSRLPEIAAALRGAVHQGMVEGAGLVKESARRRVPVGDEPMHLRDRIEVVPTREGIYVVAGDDDAWYGHLIEHGTTHTPPRPFLVPALEENVDEITDAVRRYVSRLV